jgi:UDP-glucuronate decarboxylase
MNGDYSQPVNLGNPEEYSVKDFAVLIKELTGSNSSIHFLPKTEDDPRQRKPDITTAKNKIGWSPQVPVKVGLTKAIEYFRQELLDTGEVIPTGPLATAPRGNRKK